MPTTYTLISSVTVSAAGGATSIDFTSIPSTYTDLLINMSSRTTSASFPNPLLQVNGDTASNYRWLTLYGDGNGTTGSNGSTSATFALIAVTSGSLTTSNTFGSSEIYIPNYTGSNQKIFSGISFAENNTSFGWTYAVADRWTGTSTITSVKLLPGSGNFAQNSTAYLYGINNS